MLQKTKVKLKMENGLIGKWAGTCGFTGIGFCLTLGATDLVEISWIALGTADSGGSESKMWP